MGYFIWHNPKKWNDFWGGKGVEMFAIFCPMFKVLQILMLIHITFGGFHLSTAVSKFFSLRVDEYLFFGTWMLCGQALNAGIYNAIGDKGVYYGFKMGHHVPWATGYPFSLNLRHPQYVGAYMSFLSLLPLWWSSSALSEGLIPLYLCVLGFYLWVGHYEASDENPEESKTVSSKSK